MSPEPPVTGYGDFLDGVDEYICAQIFPCQVVASIGLTPWVETNDESTVLEQRSLGVYAGVLLADNCSRYLARNVRLIILLEAVRGRVSVVITS